MDILRYPERSPNRSLIEVDELKRYALTNEWMPQLTSELWHVSL